MTESETRKLWLWRPCSHKRSKKLLREHPAHGTRCLQCCLWHRRWCLGLGQLMTQDNSCVLSHRVPHSIKMLQKLPCFPGLCRQSKHCDCSGCAALHPLPKVSTGKREKLRFCPWQKQVVKFSAVLSVKAFSLANELSVLLQPPEFLVHRGTIVPLPLPAHLTSD